MRWPEGWWPEGGPNLEKWWTRRVGTQRVGGRNFVHFSSRPIFALFCLSLAVFSLNFGCCFEGPENSKRAHLSPPAFKTTTKIQREDSQRERQKERKWSGRGKKRAKFWEEGGSAEGGPPEGGEGPNHQHTTTQHNNTNIHTKHQQQPTPTPTTTQHNKKWIGQQWIGQSRP